MRTRINWTIAVGALVALLGTAVVIAYARNDDSAGGGVATVVSATGAAVGAPAEKAGLAVRKVPKSYRPVGALTDMSQLSGLVALRPIAKDEMVTAGMFGRSGTATAGGVVLPAGKQGIGVELAFAPGGLRYVVPGNRITVWTTRRQGGRVSGPPQVLLDDIEVIATTPGAGTGAATQVTAGPGTLHFLLGVTKPQAAALIGEQARDSLLYFTLARAGASAS